MDLIPDNLFRKWNRILSNRGCGMYRGMNKAKTLTKSQHKKLRANLKQGPVGRMPSPPITNGVAGGLMDSQDSSGHKSGDGNASPAATTSAGLGGQLQHRRSFPRP